LKNKGEEFIMNRKNTLAAASWGLALGILGLGCFFSLFSRPASAQVGVLRPLLIAQANACIANLRQIEAAKEACAAEQSLPKGAAITFEQIGPKAGGGLLKAWPRCPASPAKDKEGRAGSENDYKINPLGSNAVCIHFGDANPPHRIQ
jgi:hypothetical protein